MSSFNFPPLAGVQDDLGPLSTVEFERIVAAMGGDNDWVDDMATELAAANAALPEGAEPIKAMGPVVPAVFYVNGVNYDGDVPAGTDPADVTPDHDALDDDLSDDGPSVDDILAAHGLNGTDSEEDDPPRTAFPRVEPIPFIQFLVTEGHASNGIDPQNFGDVVANAYERYMASQAVFGNTLQPPRAEQTSEEPLSFEIRRTPNSHYARPPLPEMSYDTLAARASEDYYRLPARGIIKDSVLINTKNRMTLAMAKKRCLEKLGMPRAPETINAQNAVITTAGNNRPFGFFDEPTEYPDGWNDTEEDRRRHHRNLQALLIHMQLLAGVPPEEVEPMHGPNMQRGFGPATIPGIWVNGEGDDVLMQILTPPPIRITRPAVDPTTLNWIREVGPELDRRRASLLNRRPVDLVPVVVESPIEGEDPIVVGRPRFADEVEQHTPDKVGDLSDESSTFYDFDFDAVEEDTDMENADNNGDDNDMPSLIDEDDDMDSLFNDDTDMAYLFGDDEADVEMADE